MRIPGPHIQRILHLIHPINNPIKNKHPKLNPKNNRKHKTISLHLNLTYPKTSLIKPKHNP